MKSKKFSIMLLLITLIPFYSGIFINSLHTNRINVKNYPITSEIHNLGWNTTWGKSYNYYGYHEGKGIIVDTLGNIFITGDTRNYEVDRCDVFLLKYDSDGNLLWEKTWGGSGWDSGEGIAVDGLGNLFITGYTYNDSYGAVDYYLFLLKYDSDGNLLWEKTWGAMVVIVDME